MACCWFRLVDGPQLILHLEILVHELVGVIVVAARSNYVSLLSWCSILGSNCRRNLSFASRVHHIVSILLVEHSRLSFKRVIRVILGKTLHSHSLLVRFVNPNFKTKRVLWVFVKKGSVFNRQVKPKVHRWIFVAGWRSISTKGGILHLKIWWASWATSMPLVKEINLGPTSLRRVTWSFIVIVIIKVLRHIRFFLPTWRSLPLIELIEIRPKLSLAWSIVAFQSINSIHEVWQFAFNLGYLTNCSLSIFIWLSVEVISKLSPAPLKHVLFQRSFLSMRCSRSLSYNQSSLISLWAKAVWLIPSGGMIRRCKPLQNILIIIHWLTWSAWPIGSSILNVPSLSWRHPLFARGLRIVLLILWLTIPELLI